MNEGCLDYYDDGSGGCCLLCDEAEEGCLCFECKCSKCFWYSEPNDFDGKGSCDKVNDLKESSSFRFWNGVFSNTFRDYSKGGLKKGQTQLEKYLNE